MTAPTPTYNPKIPQPTDSIGGSQNPFLINYNQLATAFAQNHVPLTAASNAGNHNVVQLVEQPVGLTTLVSEVSLYAKDVVNQADQLYYRYQGNGTEIQYSTYQIYPLPTIPASGTVVQAQYFSWLPGNIIIYFGFFIPNSVPFNVFLNPSVCKTIISVSLGVIGLGAGKYPSNMTLVPNAQGYITQMTLTSSFQNVASLPAQSYIVYGFAA